MILAQFLAQSITRVPLSWGTVGFRFSVFHLVCTVDLEEFAARR